jgi:hypothetical protein
MAIAGLLSVASTNAAPAAVAPAAPARFMKARRASVRSLSEGTFALELLSFFMTTHFALVIVHRTWALSKRALSATSVLPFSPLACNSRVGTAILA